MSEPNYKRTMEDIRDILKPDIDRVDGETLGGRLTLVIYGIVCSALNDWDALREVSVLRKRTQ